VVPDVNRVVNPITTRLPSRSPQDVIVCEEGNQYSVLFIFPLGSVVVLNLTDVRCRHSASIVTTTRFVSQIRTVLSNDPDAMGLLLGEKATDGSFSIWPFRMCISTPVVTHHNVHTRSRTQASFSTPDTDLTVIGRKCHMHHAVVRQLETC
jgi:hypothetical protein